MPEGARILAPSAIAASGDIWTDTQGMQAMPVPTAMTTDDVRDTIQEYVIAAENAIAAGFDGVELHGANGYLIEQFIRPTSNTRTDEYGGTHENNVRFAIETVQAVANAIGKEKTAIRLSPYGVFNDMPYDSSMDIIYELLVSKLNDLGILYIHLLDHSPMGAPAVPDSIKEMVRNNFGGILVFCGGYDAERAQQDIDASRADLIAVGRLFLANPDLVSRWKKGAALNDPDFSTFYTPGEKGYTDYPSLSS
jgi:N-ethylmaleimide reductase